jgi:hypothetical protein
MLYSKDMDADFGRDKKGNKEGGDLIKLNDSVKQDVPPAYPIER